MLQKQEREKTFAGFQSDSAALKKQEENQLQVIKKADLFSQGKYK